MQTTVQASDAKRIQQADIAVLILRLVLGVIFIAHGSQKLLGLFGGHGWAGTLQSMAGMGIPAPFAALAIIAEFFGGLGVLLGALTRLAAFGIASTMVVAILKVHLKNGLFASNQGFEFPLACLALALALIAYGGGKWSLDSVVASFQRRSSAPESGTAGSAAAV